MPPLTAAPTTPGPKVAVAVQHFENGTAFPVATNSGSRPESVGDAYLDYGRAGMVRARPTHAA